MNRKRELIYRLYTQREEQFIRTDIKSEFARYDDIKNGNVEQVAANFEIIKKDFFKGKGTLSKNPLRNTIYHFVVAIGVITRMCVNAGLPHDEAYTMSDIFIQEADECTSIEQVIDLLGQAQIDYATHMNELHKSNPYSIHVRHAIDYIYDHLHESLTMEQLAKIEQLNPSYFSKVFATETGSTVKAYILSVKIETAKNMLEKSEHSISDIHFSLGFSSQSAFTAAFKKITGTTPAKYRNNFNYTRIQGD
ncbi:MAG: AraC family transcriptional regulator [Lachnospiraceae bacterium]|nr:AraC family transcriptional regulator [Lachnospiraceae bacterium]